MFYNVYAYVIRIFIYIYQITIEKCETYVVSLNCQMLAYIGHTSPECLLRPGRPLNIAAHLPDDIAETAETNLSQLIQQQNHIEADYCQTHQKDIR